MCPKEFTAEYFEISQNMLSTFPKFRSPVPLHFFDETLNTVRPICDANERITKGTQEKINSYCEHGTLFISRADYESFAGHLSKKLSLILTETCLQENEIALIIHAALHKRLTDFFEQPIDTLFEPLEKDITILCEYIWADSNRVYSFRHGLKRKHSLISHSVNVCLLGCALFVLCSDETAIKRNLKDMALAFLLHDLGMTNIPDYLLCQKRPLLLKERVRVEQHPAIGLKMVRRLSEISEPIIQVISEHHERVNGKGYPRGVTGKEISLPGKICAIADSFSAMCSDRVYAQAMDMTPALKSILTDPGYDLQIARKLAQYMLHGMQ